MTTLKILALLSLFALSSCASIRIPDARICAANGPVLNGASCAHTLTSATEQISGDAFLSFLEADPSAGRGAALCMSPSDFNGLETALEQACSALGSSCLAPVRKAIAQARKRYNLLSDMQHRAGY